MKGIDRIWLKLLKGVQSVLLWSILLGTSVAQAQIIPDGTLAGERSSVTPRALGGESISGGAIRGVNLFHSFSEFNIGNQQSVYFANPTGIQNILTRVTGNTASNINGTLGIDGAANLFLLNPNGIIFGQNARLDVRGSFVGTTANAVRFGNQGDFSATNPQAPSLLTVQPSALLFNQIQGGQIVNRSQSSDRTGLSVPTGKSLLLVGGNILSDGGQITVPGGRIELGGLAEPGTIGLINSSDRWQLTFPTGVQRADITLQNQGLILNTGGLDDIRLTGRNITVVDTPLLPLLFKGLATSDRRAGNLIVNATGTLSFDYSNTQGSTLDNTLVEEMGGGRFTGENIFLKRTSLGGGISSSISRGGSLTASNTITLDGSQIQAAQNPQTGEFTGNVNISARNLNLTNGSFIQTTLQDATTSNRNEGNISLRVLDTLLLSGNSLIATVGTSGGELGGRSGDIDIQAGSIVLDGSGNLITAFSDSRRSGDIKIQADAITVNSGFIASVSDGTANGGNIDIQTRVLSVINGGSVVTSANGSGNSGNLTITALDAIELKGNTPEPLRGTDGSLIFGNSTLSTNSFGAGNAGKLSLSTRRLTVQDGGTISTGTGPRSSGQGGNLIIEASDFIDVAGEGRDRKTSSLITSGTLGTGDAGNLSITTGRFRLRDGASVSTLTAQPTVNAKGGNILIHAQEGIEMGGRSQSGRVSKLNSSTRGAAAAGNITLQTDVLSISDAEVTSTTRGAGSGGNIQMNVGSLVLNAGLILSETQGQGNAGNLVITAQGDVLLKGIDRDGFSSFISVSSTDNATGSPGSILLTADSVRLADNATINAGTGNDKQGGNVVINANRFEATGGGAVTSQTASSGRAGNIILNVRDRVFLQGTSVNQERSGLFTPSIGSGDGGNIQVNTRRLEVLDSASISSLSRGTGDAGNVNVNASLVRLNNQGAITTRSGSTNGGNITINAKGAISLRRNSTISASAGTEQAPGDGGNITINAGSIVAKPNENNTIQANARAGRGGNISIVTQGLFGITPSSVLISGQNTITASSELGVQGNVAVNQPSVQPTQGVLELPAEVLDASNQMGQVCPRNSNIAKIGKFVISGTGSLPPNPIEPLTGSTAIPLATIEGSPTTTIATVLTPNDSEIVEAQGWIKTADGKVTLVAQAAETTLSSRPTANCSTVTQQ